MVNAKYLIDTLMIGAGFIGLKEGYDAGFLENVYLSLIDKSDVLYASIFDISISGSEYLHTLPNNELIAGFAIGILSNLTAGFIKNEYGSLSNFLLRKKDTKTSIYSRFR